MKKYFKCVILLLTAALLTVSCQVEDHTTYTNPDTLTVTSELTSRLSQITTVGDVILPNDNVIDSTDCFKLKLPVQVVANGTEWTVQDENDYVSIDSIFNLQSTDNDNIQIIFPVTAIYPNQEELIIDDEQQFRLLQENCPLLDNICIQLQYPVSVSAYNIDFQQMVNYTFNNDGEVHDFLQNLNPADTYTINYPIGIIKNGSAVTVNSNAELLDAIIDALEDCGIVNPCPNPNILTNGLITYIPIANQVLDLTTFSVPILASDLNHFVTDRSGNPFGALSFDASEPGNVLQINATTQNYLMQNGTFTISFWFNRQDAEMFEAERLYENSGLFVSLGNQLNPQIRSPYVFGNGMDNPIYDTGWIQSGMLGEVNMWHHVAVTYDGTTLYLYRDGVLQSGTTTVDFTDLLTGVTTFGGNFQGYIDDIRMYNRTLNASEIEILYSLEGDINLCMN